MARQMRFEGGFQGRVNKLVDSCYSFWVGALFSIIHLVLKSSKSSITSLQTTNVSTTSAPIESDEWLFDQIALQKYILLCCQGKNGGLRDKPEKYAINQMTRYQNTNVHCCEDNLMTLI
jgi:protein farnesyltransferase subunit beta